jgi:HPt (histidine-containing phosphotransfer) domain-containing protein
MINWTRMNELRKELGEEDFQEVLDLFLEEVQIVIDRLRVTETLTELQDDMHFLKGSALNIGLSHLAMVTRVAEEKANASTLERCDLDKVISTFDETKEAFQTDGIKTTAA